MYEHIHNQRHLKQTVFFQNSILQNQHHLVRQGGISLSSVQQACFQNNTYAY